MNERCPGKRPTVLALSLILLLGTVLRLYGLEDQSLWNDELESWRQSSFDTPMEVLREGVIPNTHPPAFQLLLYGVVQCLGSREALLRLPSAVSGVLAILVIYLLGRRLFSHREGLLAAFFLAVLWAPIYYSQEARNYSLLLLFTELAAYFWLGMVLQTREREPWKQRDVLGYILTALAASYTHYFGLLLIALQGLASILFATVWRRDGKRYALVYTGIGLGYLPWLPAMLEQLGHTQNISWIHPPDITAFPAFITFALNRLKPMGILALLLFAYLIFHGLAALHRSGAGAWKSLLLSAEALLAYWLLVPFAIVYLISLVWTPMLTQRNLIILLPPVYLLLARAITQFPFSRGWRAGIALLLASVPLYHMVFVQGYYRYPHKEQYREAVRYVIDHYTEGSPSLIVGYAAYPEYFDYYFERFGSELRIDLVAGRSRDVKTLTTLLTHAKPERLWYISAHKTPSAAFLELLEREMLLLDKKSFLGAEVRLFAWPE